MEAITHQLALRLWEGNFGREKLPRYCEGGNLVRIKLPNTTASFSAAAATTTPKLAQPIRASAGAGARPEPDTTPFSSEMASHDPASKDTRIAQISSAIRVIPDFPKPGIMFQDITTLLLDPKAFKDTIDLFVERYQDKKINVVAAKVKTKMFADSLALGLEDVVLVSIKSLSKKLRTIVESIEARGFIFGPPIALAIGAKFVPMRKPKKLPGEVISEEYSLEYGTDVMEMHVGAVQEGERVLIIDDLIATGGTLGAAIRLIERVGGTVVECACVIELPELKGRARLGDKPLFVLVSST
nr:adenine phosphoribosyltransferase 1-like [Ipomoea batatas]